MTAVAEVLSRVVRRVMPDPLVIAIMLTFLSVVMALTIGRASPLEITRYWGAGFWDLLAFAMQVTLIILTGYMLARTPLVDALMNKLATLARGPKSAVALAVLISGVASWLQWGFGLIVGTLIAQKIAGRVKEAHYPLVIAGAYAGFVIYGMGISATIPLTVATSGHFLEEQMGVVPISDTIFHPVTLATTILVLITLPAFCAWLHPSADKVVPLDPTTIKPPEDVEVDPAELSFGERMNNSPVFGIFIGLMGLAYTVIYFTDGGQVNLNSVNLLFLMLGFLLFARPSRYLGVLRDGVSTVAGVIIQYPFYAGILAILSGAGLVVTFSELFVGISNDTTLPFWSFFSAGLINIMIPSGGGQWAVQGPVMIEAASQVGANYGAVAMAVSMGDQWTNMIQPFFLLPVLALSKLKLTDVMGYLVLVLIYTGVIFGASALLMGFIM